ncbi:unnamed protein product [Didymodactylos carnosus]|uniref:BTB domain-containing protein n=1 Tax=Didymodactylos carnosus TaxID=1234261 RepID=A0A814R4H8_9BILA|nr:unnamed protein product [Didymodactylos carnosus]CAF1126943.1 unnamed protein product [Didymodactylos carnosus]CAF3689678.1 unnamed protein product [Didymodactylos carnosus]CAF3890493.1 unnamed protein product [Didymodactylos carnosus]
MISVRQWCLLCIEHFLRTNLTTVSAASSALFLSEKENNEQTGNFKFEQNELTSDLELRSVSQSLPLSEKNNKKSLTLKSCKNYGHRQKYNMDDDYLCENALQSSSTNTTTAINMSDDGHGYDEGLGEITLHAMSDHVESTTKFFNNSQLSDVYIKVGNRSYYAHKFILAKSSDVLQTLLYSSHWQNEQNQHEIILEEQEECQGEVFEKFLRFFYSARVTLTEPTVVGLLCLADKYNVVALRNLCAQFMMIKAKTPNVKNGVSWYSVAKQFNLSDLKDVCMKTVAWNTEYLLKSTDDWLKVELDFVRDLLSNSDLVLINEYRLYTSLSDWLLFAQRQHLLVQYARELFPLIRFSQMLPGQLRLVEKSTLYLKGEQIQQIIKPLLYQAFRFHTFASMKQSGQDFNMEQDFHPLQWYLPREYTEMNITDRVDIQSTLRFGIQVDVQTYDSPVPSIERTAEWKVVYRKRSQDKWTLKVYRHDDTLHDYETRAQITAIIYNNERRVLQVDQGPTFVFTPSNQYELEVSLFNPTEAKELILLIKPVIA